MQTKKLSWFKDSCVTVQVKKEKTASPPAGRQRETSLGEWSNILLHLYLFIYLFIYFIFYIYEFIYFIFFNLVGDFVCECGFSSASERGLNIHRR